MSGRTSAQIVAITNTEGTWYLLPEKPFPTSSYGNDPTWQTADGQTLIDCRSSQNWQGGWRRSPTSPQALTATRRGERPLTGWRLRDPAAESPKFPLEVPNDEWAERGFHDEGHSPAGLLYAAVYSPAPDEVATFPVADMTVVADSDAPPPGDGLDWSVNIHDELRRHPELFHLFPGHLLGFREAVVGALKTIPAVGKDRTWGAHIDRDHPSVVMVSVQVPFEPQQTRFVRDIGRRGGELRTGRHIAETKSLSMSLPVVDQIAGRTRAEAKAAWVAEIQRIRALVEEALEPRPCWHCRGTGLVSTRDAAKHVGGAA
jgi:hypothetical protein